MLAAQITSTNATIATQERISEGINQVAYGTERIEEGIYGLRAAFEWGISDVVWQLEQNRDVLKSILGVLMAPLDTQAKERRKRAENAYSNGWIGDAEEEFLESEKLNKYDFAIHISLGMIYLFHKIDKNKALEYFDKAIKYAKPESKYHTSYALLYKALIKRDFGLIEEAEKCTAEAVELSPDFSEAFYQMAQYNALLENIERSLAALKTAITMDRHYSLKADHDKSFDKIRSNVDSLFATLRDAECKKAFSSYSDFKNNEAKVELVFREAINTLNMPIDDKELRTSISKVEHLLGRDSYFDCMDTNSAIVTLLENQAKFIATFIDALKARMRSIDSEISAEKLKLFSLSKNKYFSKLRASHYVLFIVGYICLFFSVKTSPDFSSMTIAWQIILPLVSVLPALIPSIVTYAILQSLVFSKLDKICEIEPSFDLSLIRFIIACQASCFIGFSVSGTISIVWALIYLALGVCIVAAIPAFFSLNETNPTIAMMGSDINKLQQLVAKAKNI